VSGAEPTSRNGKTIADRAFAQLRDAILSGKLPPGAPLPLASVAEELAMSPMPVREAIRRLSAIGLVQQSPHRSAYVSHVSREDLRDVFQMRFALEEVALRLAVEQWTDATAEKAASSLTRTVAAERKEDFDAVWVADQEFHLALYGAARSQWLIRLITPLWETSERYHRLAGSPMREFSERHADHLAILDACILGDGYLAAARLCEHLVLGANLLGTTIDGSELFSASAVRPLDLPLPLTSAE
jgi:DNA-binding GntR family transcriptional regulator